MKIPFNKASIVGKELFYIAQAVISGEIKGGGVFTQKIVDWLKRTTDCRSVFLTTSCSTALEMSAILCRLGDGDEVIMPSYTFTSTANAVILRGSRPIFCDIRADTLNLDEQKIEALVTKKTKAIMVVHYAGVSCEMDTILAIAKKHQLMVIEDAAQGVMAKYKGRHLGTMGDFGCYSFHESKNYSCGEGGAILVNDPMLAKRAEHILEKGTNRSQFFRGEVDKYRWVDIGSSYLPSEIVAAFLYAQLEQSDEIMKRRKKCWNHYHSELESLEVRECLRRPYIPIECSHNAHLYYLILKNEKIRDELMFFLKQQGVMAPFHFLPLHSSSYGSQFYDANRGPLKVTDAMSASLLRLPLYDSLTQSELCEVTTQIKRFFKRI